MMKRKIKKIMKGFLIGIILMSITLFVAAFVFVYWFLTGGPAKVTRDINDYEVVLTQPYIQTAYIVFPEKIPEGTLDTEFYNYYRDTFNSPTLQTYLKCVYDDISYQKEIDRLENTSKKYGNREKKLLRDEEKKFNYPAYIAVENAAHKYEYALLTGENEITYISTAYIEKEGITFSEDYLPYDFMTEEGRAFGSGYSIYYASVSSAAIDTDYTRDPVTEVHSSHMRTLDDSNFMVRVTLDERGREIISDCVFYVFNPHDMEKQIIDEYEMNEKVYDDLSGMEYKSMELDRGRKTVMVTYIENGEEKVKEFPMQHYPEKE